MLDFFRVVPKKRSVKIKSKNGVIFSNPSGLKKYSFYMGTVILVLAIGYFCNLYWPLVKSIIVYKSGKKTAVIESEIKKEIAEPKVIKEEFFIKIPKIGAETEVVKNISPFDKNEYLPILNEDKVAQSKYSGLPGQNTTIYLFAHSTKMGLQMVKSNSVFYLLGELKTDDLVFLQYNGGIYIYKVFDQKVVRAEEIEYMEYKEDGQEILILQTCWPIGTDWKRLLVFAKKI